MKQDGYHKGRGVIANITNPLVSVITPTYNRANFIEEAIDSVLSQSYNNLEIILVDDGSTDNTKEVINKYKTDSRFKYYYQHNQGQSIARNKGINVSCGEFICFLDSDNYWLPNKILYSVSYMQNNPDVDIIYGDGITIDEKGKIISKSSMRRYSGRITGLLLRDNFISNNTVMVRRYCFQELGGFNEKDRLAEDYELWLRMSTRFIFHYIPMYMAAYRVMDDRLSSDADKRFWANERILRQFLERFPDAVSAHERKNGFSRFFIRRSRYELALGRRGKALKDVFRAMLSDPLWQGPWRMFIKILFFPDFLRRNKREEASK